MQQKTLDRILATDLDGTFIPLDNNVQNERDLALLSTHLQTSPIPLIFVTGRHLASVENAIHQYNLPTPQMLICDVGSSIYQSVNGVWQPNLEYRQALTQRCHNWEISQVDDVLQDVLVRTSLCLQESEKQGKFKRSYYAAAVELDALCVSIKSHLQS
ncbi:MAG: HAD hydrolase family protein, partial [Planctomycetales bacterium]|nr:HAD hydrolase family protein [Planctomycetales bacterium]